jgi:alanyl-tRNA synthetase
MIERGTIGVGTNALLELDWSRRMGAARNHTATHILQMALRTVLGEHVTQSGSLVTDRRLRFDFIHDRVIGPEQLVQIEGIITDAIDACLDVRTEVMPLDAARNSGALALFGERYPETVRVVIIGDDFSRELCGGEHVPNTAQIGCLKIISVSSVGSGVKRIEALTGRGLAQYFEEEVMNLRKKGDSQTLRIRELENELSRLNSASLVKSARVESEMIDRILLRYSLTHDLDQRSVFGLIDGEKNFDDERVFLMGNVNSKNERLAISLFISEGLTARGFDGREILTSICERILGGGAFKVGGRADLAQTGCFTRDSFDECLALLRSHLTSRSKDPH